MKAIATTWRRAWRGAFRLAGAPALIALVVVVIAGIYAEHQHRQIFAERLRNQVLDRVGILRANLEGNLNANIQLVRGLVGTIATEPDMDQERFARLARHLMDESPQLAHVAAAPNFVLSLIHPVEGNEEALGLDYLANAEQRETALRVFERGETVLAGPVDLVQAGAVSSRAYPSSRARKRPPKTSGGSCRR